MRRRLVLHPALLLALLLAPAAPRVTRAAWLQTGNPLCTVPEDLNAPIGRSSYLCALLCNGMLNVYWQDARHDYGSIYTAGVSDFPPPDPQPVEPATLFLQRPGVQIPGGAVRVNITNPFCQFCPEAFVFVWTDQASTGASSIRAIRYDTVDWGPDGITVADGVAQHEPSVVHDDDGGVIVAWLEVTAEHHWVLAQRLDHEGNRLWGPAGVLVGTDTTTQTRPLLARDGAGGAYLLRQDLRGGVRTLALFRLSPDGTMAAGWPASGVVLGTAPQESPEPLLRAGYSGAWVVWSQLATLSDASPVPRPFVTFVGGSGEVSPVLTAAGTAIANGLEGEAFADDATVGAGDDLIVAYEYTQLLPEPSPSSTDLYASRFEVEGSHPAGWPESGLLVCGAPGVQRQGRLFGGGGAFFAWTDERSGDGDIYAQLLRSDGTRPAEWPADGLLVCGVAGTQQDPVIGPNTVGGGFIIWRDGRDAITNGWDLYGQTVSGDARLDALPILPTRLALGAPRPNPARGPVRCSLDVPASGRVRVDILDVAGRHIHAEEFTADRGVRELVWDLATTSGARVPPGLYVMRVRAGGEQRSVRLFVAR